MIHLHSAKALVRDNALVCAPRLMTVMVQFAMNLIIATIDLHATNMQPALLSSVEFSANVLMASQAMANTAAKLAVNAPRTSDQIAMKTPFAILLNPTSMCAAANQDTQVMEKSALKLTHARSTRVRVMCMLTATRLVLVHMSACAIMGITVLVKSVLQSTTAL